MAKLLRMGRKKLGKAAYQFTCPPKIMEQFDKRAAAQGKTRSDLIVALMEEFLSKPKPK